MKDILEEYGSLIFCLIMGAGTISGLAYVFNCIVSGWIV